MARTNIFLDDKIINEAFRYSQVSSKRELVDLALREFVESHRHRDVRELRGKVKIAKNYDYKLLRE